MRRIPALLILVLSACARPPADEAAPPAGPVLPFIADDFPAALAEAQERDLPIFVDSWAPW